MSYDEIITELERLIRGKKEKNEWTGKSIEALEEAVKILEAVQVFSSKV